MAVYNPNGTNQQNNKVVASAPGTPISTEIDGPTYINGITTVFPEVVVDTNVQITSPLSAFGELLSVEPEPVIQIDFIYDLHPHEMNDIVIGSGSIVQTDSVMRLHMPASVDSRSVIAYTKRYLRYRPGQGAEARFTAVFHEPEATITQLVGLGLIENGLRFGYNRLNPGVFGIQHAKDGKRQIEQLDLSVSATGNETATITLDGVDFSVPLTVGSVQHNLNEICNFDFGAEWECGVDLGHGDFLSNNALPKHGAFTFSSNGDAVGAFTNIASGTLPDSDWIYQTDWNTDKLDGSTGTTFTLDPTKGNVYRIEYQYLGFGDILYEVEDPETGHFVTVHIIKYANTSAIPSLNNPNMPLVAALFVAGDGATSSGTLDVGSMAAFKQGKDHRLGRTLSVTETKTISTSVYSNIISIRNNQLFNQKVNWSHARIMSVSAAADGSKPVDLELTLSPIIETGDPTFVVTDAHSFVGIDASGTTISNGDRVYGFALGKADGVTHDMDFLDIVLSRNDILTVSAKTQSGSSDVTVDITWEEF